MGFSNLGFLSLGKRFQKQRKLIQEYFSRQKVTKHMSFQAEQAKVLAIEFAKLKDQESREHVLERLRPFCGYILIEYNI
jgi:hypothetical protein